VSADRGGEGEPGVRGEGSGSSKLILFGEHAAVHGHPAVGIALPGSTSVSLDLSGRQEWTFSGILENDVSRVASVINLLERFFPAIMRRGRGVIRIDSTVPRGMGFGSSAALSVACVMAGISLLRGRLRYPFRRSLWRLANQTERLFHGTPSGIDTGLSLLGGMNAFYPDAPGLPRARRISAPPLYFVIGAVPRQKDTRTLVAEITERVRRGEVHVVEALGHLGRLSRMAVRVLVSRDPAAVLEMGRMADEAQAVLASLGLSSEYLEELLAAGREAGAVGGKLSGAGGGGAFFLVAAEEERARTVAERVRARAAAMGLPTVDTIVPVAWLGGAARELAPPR
jgi:mevalonate kinase